MNSRVSEELREMSKISDREGKAEGKIPDLVSGEKIPVMDEKDGWERPSPELRYLHPMITQLSSFWSERVEPVRKILYLFVSFNFPTLESSFSIKS